jgi:hypothetical protein
MTTSVRKTSLSIDMSSIYMPSWQGTVMWTENTLMSLGCRDSSMVPLDFIWRWETVRLYFIWKTTWYSQENHYGEDTRNHIEFRNQLYVTKLPTFEVVMTKWGVVLRPPDTQNNSRDHGWFREGIPVDDRFLDIHPRDHPRANTNTSRFWGRVTSLFIVKR